MTEEASVAGYSAAEREEACVGRYIPLWTLKAQGEGVGSFSGPR